MKVALGCRCALLLAVGCGANAPPVRAISPGPVSGMVDGRSWTFGTGEAALVRGDAEIQYMLDLYPGTITTCDPFIPAGASRVTLLMPTAVGSYQIAYDFSATLHGGDTNIDCAATEGRLLIDDITASAITGGLFVNCGPGNTVDGQFTAVICP